MQLRTLIYGYATAQITGGDGIGNERDEMKPEK